MAYSDSDATGFLYHLKNNFANSKNFNDINWKDLAILNIALIAACAANLIKKNFFGILSIVSDSAQKMYLVFTVKIRNVTAIHIASSNCLKF